MKSGIDEYIYGVFYLGLVEFLSIMSYQLHSALEQIGMPVFANTGYNIAVAAMAAKFICMSGIH